MRLLIAIAALLASVSVSAGELDGKAIECVRPTHPAPILVSFQGGVAKHFSLRVKGTEAVIEENPFSGGIYEVSPTKIEWPSLMSDGMVLDRATLVLANTDDGEPLTRWQCEVHTSLSGFEAMMEARRAQKQAEIDEKMKDNKI